MQLGVNIDHVATLRQARYASHPGAHNAEPDLAGAAAACERAGASGITVHLRADRRHIQDADVFQLRERITTKLNFELGNTPAIIEIACTVKPDEACIVPENRLEVTTEGGLDAAGQLDALRPAVQQLHRAGIVVSLFLEPDRAQIDAAAELGVEIVELHTGAFANAQGDAQLRQLDRLRDAAEYAHSINLQVNAGHGINYTNVALIREIPALVDLNIGHSIVSRAVFVGLEQAVREMLAAMNPA